MSAARWIDRGDDRGFALLIVLWGAVLLAFLGTEITSTGRMDAQLAANLRDAAQAEAAADGAVQAAAFHLLDRAAPWAADGRVRLLTEPGAAVSLRIEDEAGKVNPNTASREMLRALLQQAGMAAAAADALAGNMVLWRFPAVVVPGAAPRETTPGLGFGSVAGSDSAAVQAYRAAGRDYAPPGAPFESLEELGLVMGMTPGVLERLRPELSLLNDGDPDPALASPMVRQALATSRSGGKVAGAATQAAEAPRAVMVVAEAVTPGGARFTRRAGLRLGRAEKGGPVTVVSWDTAPGLAASRAGP